MRVKFVLFVLPVFVLLLSAESAHACSCGGGGSELCQEFGRAAAVFVGTVTGMRERPRMSVAEARKAEDEGDELPPLGYRFAVTQSFLGVAGAEAEVWTGRGGGDCGYEFERGASYLVYAYRLGKSGRLGTITCTRTRPIADAAEDLEFLRGLAGRPAGVTISGTVGRRRQNLEGSVKGGGPMSGVSVVVEGGGERREVSTDAGGRFSLSGLRAGTYKVRPLLPEELAALRPEAELTVTDRGCASTYILVVDNGRVGGVVTDEEGRPAARVRLTLVDPDDPELERGYGKGTNTDEEGRYEFTQVPPGRYLLAVNLARFPEYGAPTHAFPRTYYPAAPRADGAEVITVGEGETVRGLDLRLPPRRAERAVEIVVAWDDGRPAAGAFVIYRDVTYHDRSNPYGAHADAEGHFTLRGYEGQTFVVEARAEPAHGGTPPRSGPRTINLSEQHGPLKLVLTQTR